MKDTDWRPSACLVCGELRAAQEFPVCANPDCPHCGVRQTALPQDVPPLPAPTAQPRRIIQYQDREGKTFTSLPDAVASDINALFLTHGAEKWFGQFGLSDLAQLTNALVQNPTLRTQFVKLLKELG